MSIVGNKSGRSDSKRKLALGHPKIHIHQIIRIREQIQIKDMLETGGPRLRQVISLRILKE